jgi:hypothetical protein
LRRTCSIARGKGPAEPFLTTDRELAGQRASLGGEQVFDFGQILKQPVRESKQPASIGRQRDPGRAATKQEARFQLLFKRIDGIGDRRGRQVEPSCRRSEATGLYRSGKAPQLLCFQHPYPDFSMLFRR